MSPPRRGIRVKLSVERSILATYDHDDYVKVEIVDHETKESEWLWVRVEYCDDTNRLVFGRLDNEPVVNTDLTLGQRLAISYDNVRDHRKPSGFSAFPN